MKEKLCVNAVATHKMQQNTDNDLPVDFPGTVTICEFEGKFTDIERVDQNYYTLSLEKIEVLNVPKMWIENGYRFLKEDEPYGLEKGEKFILYMPETPIEQLSEEFLTWRHLRHILADSTERQNRHLPELALFLSMDLF